MPCRFTATRRQLLLGAAALPVSGWASGDDYPRRPIEWVVPYAAGGGTDVVARLLAPPMGRALGQPLVISNKPGAATNIGADSVARAKADGYTVLTADTATLAANPFLYPHLSYNAATDFTPVGLLVRFPLLLVVNSLLPIRNYAEFVAWVRAQPQGASYGTPGAGTPHHLATELLRFRSKLPFVHVPYRGSAPAVQDVMTGQLAFMLVDSAAAMPHLGGGRLRAIAVASPRRLPALPQVPTLHEQGVAGFEAFAWQGMVTTTGTPAPRVARLSQALQSALADGPTRAKLHAMGLELTPGSPQDMQVYVEAERHKWGEVIQASNILLD